VEVNENNIRNHVHGVGDTQFLSGRVSGKPVEDDCFYVDVELKMVNQCDEQTVEGEATVMFPSRVHGSVLRPKPPTALERKARQMFERHNALRP